MELINRILDDREKRYNRVIALAKIYDLPVICGKVNYPGEEKNTPEAKKGFSILMDVLNSAYGMYIAHSELSEGFDGSSLIMVIKMEPLQAKRIAVSIEDNHKLGRIFDIDVYVKDGFSLTRENMGKAPRSCIICGDNPRVCMKSGRHKADDVVNAVNKIICRYGEGYED